VKDVIILRLFFVILIQDSEKQEIMSKKKDQLIEELRKTLDSVNKSMYDNGLHLTEQPFIPEYLGFVHTKIVDANDIVRANVYTKNGYNITRYIDTDKPQWIVLTPDEKQVEILLNSMYDAFIILNALGLVLPIKKYVQDGAL
jgi:Trm5-related predicted tRNA methylase